MAGPQQQICWQHSSGKCTVPLSPARSSLIQAPHTATFATVLPTPHKVAAALPHTQRGPSDPSPCSCKWEGMLSMDSVIASSPGGSGMLLRLWWGAAGLRGLWLSFPGSEQGSRVGTAQGTGFYHVPYYTAAKHSGAAGERVGTNLCGGSTSPALSPSV